MQKVWTEKEEIDLDELVITCEVLGNSEESRSIILDQINILLNKIIGQ